MNRSRYEYLVSDKTVTSRVHAQVWLNDMGDEGWRVCHVLGDVKNGVGTQFTSRTMTIIFERECELPLES